MSAITLIKEISRVTFVVLLFCVPQFLVAQDSITPYSTVTFPSKKYGICFGNSQEFSGIRINFRDVQVKRVSGVNFSLWIKMGANEAAAYHGINLGGFPSGGSFHGFNAGLLGCGTDDDQTGLSLGGLVVGCGGNLNGIAISGIYTSIDGLSSKINGAGISGLMLNCGYGINGLAAGGLLIVSGHHINGLAVTAGYLETETIRGLSLAGYSKTKTMYGLSIAIFNSTQNLHGLQVGVLNHAGNNPKGLKYLPLINLSP